MARAIFETLVWRKTVIGNRAVKVMRVISFLLQVTLISLFATAADLPKVKLFTTGGTIQGSAENRDEIANYRPAVIKGQQLLDDLPEVKTIAEMSWEEIAATGSGGIDTKILLNLAKSINAWLAQPNTAGAVVTHGTATLEETAYFLNLTIHSEKPVVVVGAMRPFTAISRDGPLNLYNAVRTAASPQARDKGVMVLLNDEINAARDVTKTNTERVNTFESRDLGPIGFADADRIVFYRKLLYRHTHKSEFEVDQLTDLPRVDIVYGYQEGGRAAVDALIAGGAKGIILDDSAPGFAAAARDGRAKGVVFVQSDRKGSGRVLTNPRTLASGIVTADNLNAQKARQLLRLALTKTSDPQEIQRIFNEY
jgi:L-asparaginase